MNPTTNETIDTDKSSVPSLDLKSFVEQLDLFDGPLPLEAIQELLGRLEVSIEEIEPYLHFDADRYQRNRIAQTDNFEALFLCFESGQRTPIHDHAGSACGVKVVEGTATETIFEMSEGGWLLATGSDELVAGGVVGSIDMDIHQVSNLQDDSKRLVTLHIYSPPLGEVGNYLVEERQVTKVKAPARVKLLNANETESLQ